jgi:cytoskeletal protein CcmA (bactofilin family)
MLGKDVEKLQSFLGTQSELQGELRIKGTMRLDGAVEGKIEADQVILGKTAFIKGEILAKKIIVGGVVEGTLRAADLLEISSNGRVKGNIFANQLVMLEGCQFSGRIEMRPDKPNVMNTAQKIKR